MAKEQRSPIEALLDMDDTKPIVLFDENDNAVEFEQVAIIPKAPRVYAVLKPIKDMEGIKEDEALVFAMEEDENGEDVIGLITDEKTIEWVFEEYYKLLDADDKK